MALCKVDQVIDQETRTSNYTELQYPIPREYVCAHEKGAVSI